MRWTLIVEPSGRPGNENMSIDYSLLRMAQEGVGFLRIYRWDPPCLSFGRNEPARDRYDRQEIERLGLDTVRRPTGGRAVWHDKEVTYAVAAPTSTFGSLRETYNIIHATLVAALRRIGVVAHLAPRPSGRIAALSGGACFAAPVGGEIITAGGKLVGSAQVREGNAFLQHGSVLLEDCQDVVAEVTHGGAVAPVATSLSASLGRTVHFSEVADAIAAEAAVAWRGDWRGGHAEPIALAIGGFTDPAWTWRR
jgi:lipoate-protein ligase A